MSEFNKLRNEHSERLDTLLREETANFLFKVGELQINCKHEKTHWIQEIRTDGSLSSELVKRCYVCGSTVETFALLNSEQESLLNMFDESVEAKKASVYAENKEK